MRWSSQVPPACGRCGIQIVDDLGRANIFWIFIISARNCFHARLFNFDFWLSPLTHWPRPNAQGSQHSNQKGNQKGSQKGNQKDSQKGIQKYVWLCVDFLSGFHAWGPTFLDALLAAARWVPPWSPSRLPLRLPFRRPPGGLFGLPRGGPVGGADLTAMRKCCGGGRQ